ncbi:MAG: hypothetical protein AAF204_05500, partial [Pseudomonadota bacterium]
MSSISEETIQTVEDMAGKYEAGFVTDIETDKAPKGLNEEIVKFISAKKDEPEWLLEWRLKAFRQWQDMPEPTWAKVEFPEIDYQDAYYYAAPKSMEDRPESLDDVDPKLLETYEKLGIPLREQEILAGVKNPHTEHARLAGPARHQFALPGPPRLVRGPDRQRRVRVAARRPLRGAAHRARQPGAEHAHPVAHPNDRARPDRRL